MVEPDAAVFEPLAMGNHQMPGIWRYLFPEDLQSLKLPAERHATCGDCYEVKRGEYRDDCRCCTYFPELGNFLLGLALASDSRDAVLPLVHQRYVLPFGMTPSPLRYQRSVAAYAQDRFGQEPWMVCPFVEASTFHCRIYPFRNSICSTFFCTNDHGESGKAFWGGVQALVGQVEAAIAQWCMDQVGLSHETYVHRLDELAADVPAMSEPQTLAWSHHVYSTLWGDWCGREVEFLEACAQLVTDHRRDLFDIARQQPSREALVYESRVRQLVPETHRHHAPEVAERNTAQRPIDTNWYKLQLKERQLWELPFHQGPVVLSSAVEIIANPRDDAWSEASPEPFMVRSVGSAGPPEVRELFAAVQVDLLRVFERPQRFAEPLFRRPELERVEDPRAFLAQCLRLGILVPAPTPAIAGG